MVVSRHENCQKFFLLFIIKRIFDHLFKFKLFEKTNNVYLIFFKVNLSREAGHTEDSSSEENQVTPETSKPVPPPRPKSCVGLPTGSSGGRRGTDLRRSASAIVRPKSAAVVASVGTELAAAADAVAQLHRRLAASSTTDSSEADRILSGLTAAISRAQTLLHDL